MIYFPTGRYYRNITSCLDGNASCGRCAEEPPEVKTGDLEFDGHRSSTGDL